MNKILFYLSWIGKILWYIIYNILEFILMMCAMFYYLTGCGLLLMIGGLVSNPGIVTYVLCGLNVLFWIVYGVIFIIERIKEEER